jgi:DNA processing protein
MVCVSGSRLPVGLRDLDDPPRQLFVTGELPPGPWVAVVGTRRPSDEGRAYARRLAGELASEGVVVVSGGATGVDRAAHEGALDVGGATVVVGPSSFEHPYPEPHRELFQRIVENGGAYVTARHAGVKPHRAHFFARNALMAALTQALVLVESRLRGGGRNAVKCARDLARPVFAVPGSPWAPVALGCLLEIRAGARLLLSSRDVLELLRATRNHPIAPVPALQPSLFETEDLAGTSQRLLIDSEGLSDVERLKRCLAGGGRHPDEICELLDLTASKVQQLLLTLTLEGALATHPSGWVKLVT